MWHIGNPLTHRMPTPLRVDTWSRTGIEFDRNLGFNAVHENPDLALECSELLISGQIVLPSLKKFSDLLFISGQVFTKFRSFAGRDGP